MTRALSLLLLAGCYASPTPAAYDWPEQVECRAVTWADRPFFLSVSDAVESNDPDEQLARIAGTWGKHDTLCAVDWVRSEYAEPWAIDVQRAIGRRAGEWMDEHGVRAVRVED